MRSPYYVQYPFFAEQIFADLCRVYTLDQSVPIEILPENSRKFWNSGCTSQTACISFFFAEGKSADFGVPWVSYLKQLQISAIGRFLTPSSMLQGLHHLPSIPWFGTVARKVIRTLTLPTAFHIKVASPIAMLR